MRRRTLLSRTLGAGLSLVLLMGLGCSGSQENPPPRSAELYEVFSPAAETLIKGDSTAPFLSEFACHVAGNRLFVWDRVGGQVIEFDLQGQRELVLGKTRGSGPGELRFPYGVVQDDSGNIYVNDRGNQRIEVFTSDGVYRRAFSTDAQVERILPFRASGRFGLLLVGVAPFTTENGEKYLARVLDNRGGEWRSFAPLEHPVVKYSWAVACGPSGHLYLANALGQAVQVFDSLGHRVRSIPLSSPTVIPLRTKLNPEPRSMAEIRRQLRVLREETHTEVAAVDIAGDFLLVQHRVVGPKQTSPEYLLDVFSLDGRLRFYGVGCPGYLCSRQGTELVYFAHSERGASGFDRLALQGYRVRTRNGE